ncbi:DUF4423 domain-containing protein [Bdellovibrio bacteriovorus]|uniref:DUF4423 domain-containing protein n=1 Tax=Bdellovibrio bacteriovorus TaxID=959 RepID=UPI0035A6D166
MELAALLRTELAKRQNKNPRYSLRAFAKSLDQDAGTLTRVMSGQRVVKQPTALAVMQALNIDSGMQDQILASLSSSRKQRTPKTAKMQPVSVADFENIFETTNIHLLASLRLKKFRPKRNWDNLARHLSLAPEELESRLISLEKIGAIAIKNSTVEVISKNLSTLPIPFTTERRKAVQKDFLDQAKRAIDEVPFELRDNCTLTIPISGKDLAKIKQILQKARTRINDLSEKKSTHDHIYNVSMAVYPVIL